MSRQVRVHSVPISLTVELLPRQELSPLPLSVSEFVTYTGLGTRAARRVLTVRLTEIVTM